MITIRLIAITLLAALCAAPVIAKAEGPPTTYQLQQVFADLLFEIEEAAGLDHKCSQAISEQDKEGRILFYNAVADKEKFFQSAKAALERIDLVKATLVNGEPGVPDALKETITRTLNTQPYPPNYTDTLAYYIAYGLGLTGSNEDRCDGLGLEIYEDILYGAEKLSEVADAICTGVGCDPTGIGCIIGCAVTEVYRLAVLIARIPLDACNKHSGSVDAAEIEAGYENGKSTLINLGTHDGNLTTHDTEIKAELSSIQTQLDQQQALLEEIIELLKTPQGRRQGWNRR
jgi:hypothetical protein